MCPCLPPAAVRALQLWDLNVGDCVLRLELGQRLAAGCFTPNGRAVALGAADGTAAVWNLAAAGAPGAAAAAAAAGMGGAKGSTRVLKGHTGRWVVGWLWRPCAAFRRLTAGTLVALAAFYGVSQCLTASFIACCRANLPINLSIIHVAPRFAASTPWLSTSRAFTC